ncbi:MAG TPA: phospho-N-acetylmuramoyl-pentapeptide-transferase [Patescibacteria group bacterium]|nr:phospho-N-acetylmuramoyl-pentapeptide-transferase [Patescibacteria group bacterium]
MNLPNLLPLSLGFLIFSFLINAVLIVPFIDLLYKLKFQRQVEGGKNSKSLFDKLHDKKAGTPTGGGVLLVVTVVIMFAILFPIMSSLGVYITTAHNLLNELFVIFFTFISFGILGLLDDYVKIFKKGKEGQLGYVFGLSKKTKFAIQFVLAGVVSFWLYHFLGIQFVHIPLLSHVINLGIFYIPFAMFVIVFFTNAFNFTDGLDGLASGLLAIYLFAFIVIAAANLDTPLSIFIALWIGAVMAFLYFNVNPARIWLGDTGALSFGAMIAVIGLLTGNVASLFIIGGIFVIEAFSSLIQILGWKILKRRIFPIAPIHHAFLAIGWEEPKIVMRAWLAGIMLAILGLWLARI